MSSGMKAAPYLVDSASDPLGWRVANGLAIAAPYLLAAVLFGVLYLQPSSPAPAQAAVSAPLAPAADLAASPGSAAPHAPRPAPVSASLASAPVPSQPKNAAIASGPASTPTPAKSAAPAASGPATSATSSKDEPLPTQPVPVDPVIAGTMKLSGDAPGYPSAARSAGVQGVVVLSAIVGPDGTVQSVEPVSGPALLQVATLSAVRSWHYRPYLIYGKPVAFQTQVIINFKLDAPPQ